MAGYVISLDQGTTSSRAVLWDETGAMRAMADQGLRVPEDISVIGYDGLKIGSFYTPKLSTVSQSVELLARRSFSVLMDQIEHGGGARHLTVPFTLSNRESVRKLEIP